MMGKKASGKPVIHASGPMVATERGTVEGYEKLMDAPMQTKAFLAYKGELLRSKFWELDLNKSGSLSFDNLMALFPDLPKERAASILADLFHRSAKNPSEELSFQDLAHFMATCKKTKNSELTQTERQLLQRLKQNAPDWAGSIVYKFYQEDDTTNEDIIHKRTRVLRVRRTDGAVLLFELQRSIDLDNSSIDSKWTVLYGKADLQDVKRSDEGDLNLRCTWTHQWEMTHSTECRQARYKTKENTVGSWTRLPEARAPAQEVLRGSDWTRVDKFKPLAGGNFCFTAGSNFEWQAWEDMVQLRDEMIPSPPRFLQL